jgi:hypothetical protein
MIIQVDQEGFNLVMQLCDNLHRAAGLQAEVITNKIRLAMKDIQNSVDTLPKEG